MDYENEEVEIDLLHLAEVLWQRKWIIAAVSVLSALLVLAGTVLLITPKYEASAMLYINNNKMANATQTISSADLAASQSLVDTFSVILTSRNVLEEVNKEAGTDYTYEELLAMLSSEAVNDTEILKITFTSTDPKEAAKLANTALEVSSKVVVDTVEASSVKIVDRASVPDKPSSPSKKKNTLIGFAIGFILSCGIIILLDLMDKQIRNEAELTALLDGVPVLGIIPSFYGHSGTKYGYGYSKSGYGGYGYGSYGGYEQSAYAQSAYEQADAEAQK